MVPCIPPISPCQTNLEWVNGGYGVKNPLMKTISQPPDVDPTPAPSADPNTFACRICGKVGDRMSELSPLQLPLMIPLNLLTAEMSDTRDQSAFSSTEIPTPTTAESTRQMSFRDQTLLVYILWKGL